jgi:predicted lipoprotein with Yx(FWY)xxD motif
MTRTSIRRTIALGAISLLAAVSAVAVACGDDDDDDDAAPTTAATRPAATTAPTAAAGDATEEADDETTPVATEPDPGDGDTPGTSAEIAVGADGAQILTDPDGLTLYVFANDTAGGSSTCTGQCEQVWPPHTITGDPVAPEGATGEFAVITRDDGTQQLTYNGLPLYRFVNDTAPGQTNGATVPNWSVATP